MPKEINEYFDAGSYEAAIGKMRNTFNSHEFILRLAQANQAAYIAALYSRRDDNAPFRTVHAALAARLHGFEKLVKKVGDAASPDIFGDEVECAEWQRKT